MIQDKLENMLKTNKRPVIAISYDYKEWILEKFANYIRELNKNRYDFLLFSVHHLRKNPLYYKKLFRYVDLILNMLPSVLLDIQALTDKPVINTVHHWVDDDFIRPFIKNSQYIITVSNQWKDRIINDFDFPLSKISMIHCGIEKKLLKNYDPLYSKDNKISIGFFAKNTSNENDRKGTSHFKNFIYYLKDHNVLDKFKVIISGAGWEDFVKEIKSYGAHIQYIPFTPEDEMPSLYRSLDFYLMLSNIEGGPATILESMALKVPVVANNIGLVRDIGIDGHNIILVENSNYEQIYNKLIFYIEHKKERCYIIKNGYETAKHMTYEEVFQSYTPIFDKFLRGYPEGGITALNLRKTQKFLDKNVPLTITSGKK